MDDNGVPSNVSSSNRLQEIFQRTQETQIERQLPIDTAGIVPVPRGSRGPRSLYIKRHEDSFGFTLRHFIVYPPDSVAKHYDGRHAAVGALLSPMDTIFVKNVKDWSPAKQAGLQRGDRLVAVNGVPTKDKTYSQVVQLVINSPEYLHLLVVPKEEDVLQRFFAETAYNPVSNQHSYPDIPNDRTTAQQFLAHHLSREAAGVQVDAISWRSLQQPYAQTQFTGLQRATYDRTPRSADNLHYGDSRQRPGQQEIYAEIYPNEYGPRNKCRAAPQVPLYRKTSRRSSEGNGLSEKKRYKSPDNSGVSSPDDYNMKTVYKSNYEGANNYPNAAGCRLSLDMGRRESSSSLSSSIADGSKESLASFDSTSTLTGHETDDSAIMTRFRKSVQQKEEFLGMPSNTNMEEAAVRREFYSRPNKLERQMWPPTEKEARTSKPAHQNVMRVRNDLDNERELIAQQQNGGGMAEYGVPQQRGVTSPKDRMGAVAPGVANEADTAPSGYDSLETANASEMQETTGSDVRRTFHPGLQIVHKRAKDFESGHPMPEDDLSQSNKMNFSRSELSRLSSKKLVPNVPARAQEYDSGAAFETRRDTSGTSTNSSSSMLRRIQRDSRSLDSSDVLSNETPKFHVRSNSADSWVGALSSERSKEDTNRIGIQDAAITGRKTVKDPGQEDSQPGELSPLIPESVEHLRLAPTLSITPTSGAVARKVVRPNQLDLDVAPIRPMRHLKPPKSDVEAQLRRSVSPNSDDERAMRRESYLKATEGGRMHIDSDLSDGGDISPQALRSGSVSSGSTASLDRDKTSGSPSSLDKDKYILIREGMLHSKILEIDGKRSTDRSWKQALIVLKGPKLFLYKDRNYQSIGSIADSLDPSLSSGVDMRTSVVRVAEDYTKRKNVLRVSSVKPCRSEFLLQTENTEELAEWVKAFQEQVAASTEAELEPIASKQQAVPQLVPASTTIQVQGSHLSPQWNKQKVTSSRNRSPTGQSPVSKSRKPSQIADPATSPKTKTWRGRMVKQFRKFNQGGNSPSSPTAPEGSTFGVSLEDCLPSLSNVYLPRFVEVCTEIIDARGLQTIGIYRVPGNNASITALTEEINKNYEEIPLEDPRWNDLHVVSSLLKSFFRKMPDSLITVQLYPCFIRADKIEDPKARMEELRKLVNSLPKHNYHTLKHVVVHLRRVADNSNVNKMEAKNLAIVFGPTIIRPEGDNMEHMVNHMTNQCKIVESLLSHADWFFPENYSSDKYMPVPIAPHEGGDDFETHHNQALLLHNISKYEALKDPKEKNGALLSSIISAAQRKVLRKPHKSHSAAQDCKDEPASPTNLAVFPAQTFSHSDLKENSCVDGKLPANIPTTVMEIEQNKRAEKVPWFNYSTDKEEFLRRIENFKQETEAMLQLPRKTEISINNIDSRPMGQLSYSACNVSQNPRMSLMTGDNSDLARTHRSVNVYARNSLNLLDGPYSLQCDDRKSDVLQCCVASDNSNRNGVGSYREASDRRHRESGRGNLRRGSSVENVATNAADASSGNLKKVKFENEINSQRTGSLDSLNKLANDDESLLSTMTKLIDEKLKEEHSQSTFPPADIPFVDESPEKHKKTPTTATAVANDKENILQASDLYRNPSLHKSQIGTTSRTYKKEEKVFKEKEKEEDTMATENVPDNDRHVSLTTGGNNKSATSSKLKRSESLNKPERTVSPMNKLKRSESLNKAGDKLKRSDSLSKTEKTENNNNKRRELSLSNRRFKDSTKNKRKNGMPDRSIKRRHTVGGTKDPDKITWLLDNKNQEEVDADVENLKEKNLRTSSPDLSSTRRDRFLFEINLIGPENMVVALRQHLIGTRPQSFPESTVFKVPLESHV